MFVGCSVLAPRDSERFLSLLHQRVVFAHANPVAVSASSLASVAKERVLFGELERALIAMSARHSPWDAQPGSPRCSWGRQGSASCNAGNSLREERLGIFLLVLAL